MDVPVREVDARDLPVVAVAASGGGYRAMLNTIGSLQQAKESGLWDCLTFVSGVSGTLGLYSPSSRLLLFITGGRDAHHNGTAQTRMTPSSGQGQTLLPGTDLPALWLHSVSSGL